VIFVTRKKGNFSNSQHEHQCRFVQDVKENEVPGYFSREEIITGSVIRIVVMFVAATGNMMTCFTIYGKPGLRPPTNISIVTF